MRLLAVLVVSSAVIVSVGSENRPDPSGLLERYVELHHLGDVNGLIALHTEDAEFLIPGQVPIRGTSDLRNLMEWDAVLESELMMEGVTVDGDTISIEHVIERNRLFKALGVSEVRYQPGTRFVLRDRRVSGVYPSRFTPEIEVRVGKEFGELIEWMSKNRPQDYERLLPKGKFRYDGASARLWLQVVGDWNKAKE